MEYKIYFARSVATKPTGLKSHQYTAHMDKHHRKWSTHQATDHFSGEYAYVTTCM